MKKTILALILFVSIASAAVAQCSELFISEYIEGTRNNKAIEIYNPSKQSIDLSNYRFTRWQNGAAVWTSQFSDSLFGTIGPNEVKVLVLDRRDTTQTGQDTPVVLGLRLKADLWLSKDYNTSFSMSFNGDDALSLDKKSGNNYVPVDIFGKIGQQPKLASNPSRTIGWSDSFPYNTGLGLWYTIDKTLIRKPGVKQGVAANPTYFNPKTEWAIYPVNTFDSLRTHICDCHNFPASVKNTAANTIVLFPNPAGEEVRFISSVNAETISLVDFQGREMPISYETTVSNGFQIVRISLSALPAGIYQLRATDKNGISASSRLIKE